MPATADEVRYLFDENLLRLGRALASLRDDVGLVGRHPVDLVVDRGMRDSEWIPLVASRGWVVVTNDKGLRVRPSEAELALAYGLKVVHLRGVGGRSAWDQAVRLLSRWDAIERHVTAHPNGPWWLSVQASGLKQLRFSPGERPR